MHLGAVDAIGQDLTLVPAAELRVDPLDLGLHRGYAVFDYFPVRGGEPWFLGDYLARFRRSARASGIPLLFDDAAIAAHLWVLAEANALTYGGCKLLLTGGASADGYTPRRPTLYTYALAKAAPDAADEPGGPPVRVNLLAHARERPAVKTTNYAAALRHQGRQLETNAAELVYHDGGYVTEASRSNVFAVTAQGQLWVPPTDSALAGVTRHHVVVAARKGGLTVLERSLPLKDLLAAPEVFITSSSRGVHAVGRIEDTLVGDGGVGEVTRRAADLFLARATERRGWRLASLPAGRQSLR